MGGLQQGQRSAGRVGLQRAGGADGSGSSGGSGGGDGSRSRPAGGLWRFKSKQEELGEGATVGGGRRPRRQQPDSSGGQALT